MRIQHDDRSNGSRPVDPSPPPPDVKHLVGGLPPSPALTTDLARREMYVAIAELARACTQFVKGRT